MKTKSRILTCLGAVAIAIFVWVIAGIYSQAHKDSPQELQQQDVNQKVDHFPIVVCCEKDYSVDEVRNGRGRLYEKKIKLLWDKDAGGNFITRFSHWNDGLTALPVAASALVVRGTVTDVQAYLTPERTDVYSEFSIQVGEVLKNNIMLPTFVGDNFVASRNGGRVRFASGRTLSYVVHGQDMPRKDNEYIFFLKHQENQYVILTAYKVFEGKIYPLDGENAPSGSRWKGDDYKGADLFEFLAEISHAIEQTGGHD